MQHHIVYRVPGDSPQGRRGLQRIQLERLAVLSTYEEARLYIKMCALIDRRKYGRGKNGEYHACALRLDMPQLISEFGAEEDTTQGWILERSPWFSAFCEPLEFNSDGRPTFHRLDRYTSFETTTERAFCEQACGGDAPRFGAGDIVSLKWSYSPDTFAVITALGTPAGPSRKLEGNHVWNGWYHVLYWSSGTVCEEAVHADCDFEMEPVAGELPSHLAALEPLSRYFRGESLLTDPLVYRMVVEPVLLDGTKVFPFDLFEEVPVVQAGFAQAGTEDDVSPALFCRPNASAIEMVDPARHRKRPPMHSVFVVLRVALECFPCESTGESFLIDTPHAAFTTLERAQAHVVLCCAELRSCDTEKEISTRALLRQRHRKRAAVDMDPGWDPAYYDRIQVVEVLTPTEPIADEDLVQSLAFEKLVKRTWCYNGDGDLLWESPDPSLELSDLDRYPFKGEFRVGDMVYVVPQAVDPESESVAGALAVVSEVPVSKEDWRRSGAPAEAWNPFYVVDIVGADQYLQQYHVPESSLLQASFTVAPRDAFLPLWAKHLRGALDFPEELVEGIRQRRILLVRYPCFDIKAGTIVK